MFPSRPDVADLKYGTSSELLLEVQVPLLRIRERLIRYSALDALPKEGAECVLVTADRLK